MLKKIGLACVALTLLAACARGISMEKYIEVMADLGCKGLSEGSPAAEEVLKEKGVTLEQIQDFRKKGDADDMMKASMEIANLVMACHGVGAKERAGD